MHSTAHPARAARLKGTGSAALPNVIGFVVFVMVFAIFALAFPLPLGLSVLNLTIAVLAAWFVFIADSRPNSLSKIMFFCCITFFAIFPRIEYSERIVYWRGSVTVLDYYFITSVYALLGMIVFALFYFWARSRPEPKVRANDMAYIRKPDARVLIAVSAVVVLTIYFLNDFSPANVFIRASFVEDKVPSSLLLVYQTAFRPIPSICLVLYLLSGDRKLPIVLILGALMLIGNPITGFARWQGAMLYMAALLAAFPWLLNIRNSVVYFLAVGLVFVFPILDLFRRVSQNVQLQLSFAWIYHGHFDSFQSFARSVELEFVSWGEQLLGVFLFFVPRSVWDAKPVSSSVEIATQARLSLNNISLNYFGEGYVNFSVAGIVLFGAILGVLCGWLDRRVRFWAATGHSMYVFWLLFLGGLVFVFRGALLSAFAYMVGTFVAAIFVGRIAVRRERRTKARSGAR